MPMAFKNSRSFLPRDSAFRGVRSSSGRQSAEWPIRTPCLPTSAARIWKDVRSQSIARKRAIDPRFLDQPNRGSKIEDGGSIFNLRSSILDLRSSVLKLPIPTLSQLRQIPIRQDAGPAAVGVDH